MSTPPIALKASGKVADAAICMTEHKVGGRASGASAQLQPHTRT